MIAESPVFSSERVPSVWDEIYPLFLEHHAEIGEIKDLPLDPNCEAYKNLDALGMVRVYIAREEGKIIGYCVFFISQSMHYKQIKDAVQDIVFINKDHRGFGKKFMEWCDEELRKEGVNVIHRYSSSERDLGPIYKRNGYDFKALVYSRRF